MDRISCSTKFSLSIARFVVKSVHFCYPFYMKINEIKKIIVWITTAIAILMILGAIISSLMMKQMNENITKSLNESESHWMNNHHQMEADNDYHLNEYQKKYLNNHDYAH